VDIHPVSNSSLPRRTPTGVNVHIAKGVFEYLPLQIAARSIRPPESMLGREEGREGQKGLLVTKTEKGMLVLFIVGVITKERLRLKFALFIVSPHMDANPIQQEQSTMR